MFVKALNVRTVIAGASLLLPTSLFLAGCTGAMTPVATPNAIAVTGNWQVSSSAAAASKLPAISGELTGSSRAMTGIFHSQSPSACVAPAQAFEVSGAADAKLNVRLTGTNVAGGTLTIRGTLAADGKSLTDASYQVAGGSCAMSAPAQAEAQSYSSITGTYAGSFSDGDGQVITLTASLTQAPASDTDGNFQLSGTGTFPSNPCFSSPVSLSNSQVTGGDFNFTYADQTTGNTVNVIGNFSTDGKTLTVTQWTLTGSCGPDSGTGLLTQQ
jgi:hypothetical protein